MIFIAYLVFTWHTCLFVFLFVVYFSVFCLFVGLFVCVHGPVWSDSRLLIIIITSLLENGSEQSRIIPLWLILRGRKRGVQRQPLSSLQRNGGRCDVCDPNAVKDGKMSSCGDCWHRAVWLALLGFATCSRCRCIVQIVTPVCRLPDHPGRRDTIHKAVAKSVTVCSDGLISSYCRPQAAMSRILSPLLSFRVLLTRRYQDQGADEIPHLTHCSSEFAVVMW